MRMPITLAALALAGATSAPLAAEPWKEVDQLPGGISVTLDEGSVTETVDGTRKVVQATFRRAMPSGPMESDVAVDCAAGFAKIRGVRLLDDSGNVQSGQSALTADYNQVRDGSSEAIYFKALCGKDVSPAENTAG